MVCKVWGSLAVLGLAGMSSAQKLVFNFEKIAEKFYPAHSSSTGHVFGYQDLGGAWDSNPAVWSKAYGVVPLQGATQGKFIPKISRDGEVFGLTSEGLVKWNLQGQRQLVLTIPPTSKMNVVDINENGEVLLSEPVDSQLVKTYRFASGSMNQIVDNPTFRPRRFGPGQSFVGTVKDPIWGFDELNLGLLITIVPSKVYAAAGYAGGNNSWNADLSVFKDGSYLVRSFHSEFSGNTARTQKLMSPTGGDWGQFYFGSFFSTTLQPTVFASGGFAFGSNRFDPTLSYSVRGNYAQIDSTNFAPGSLQLTQFAPDNDADSGYLLGYAEESGKQVAVIGTYTAVPEPLTLAALGLGVAALARRRKKSSN